MAGMTLKQAAKAKFFDALEAYRNALKTGENLVLASLLVHAASGSVPKSYARLVRRAYRGEI